MLRHIVFFKLKNKDSSEDLARLISKLESLKAEIPLVKELVVGKDVGHQAKSYDVALNTTFDSMEDLAEYTINPYHLKVVELIKELCETTCKVDYEI